LLTDGPRPAGDEVEAAYDAALSWWEGPDPDLLRIVPADPILAQRDANLANYLWDGERVRIVDFEDAAISDPADELALMIEHISARELDAGDIVDRFTVDPSRLLAARRVWAMFWLRLLLPGGRAATRTLRALLTGTPSGC
jgi:aminoglycoside phosphotransferase (APT) family kinase protein